MTVLMTAPVFAQQDVASEKRNLSENTNEFEVKEFKDFKEPKESLRSQTPLLTKTSDSSAGDGISVCPDCATTSREAMTSEEKRQLRRDIHEAGRKIYPRHPRNSSRHP